MPALVIALAACAEHRPYRTSTAPVDVTGPLSDARVQAAIQSTSIERYDGYSIAVIEFDDQGRFWDRRQFAAMSAEIIRQARADEDSGVGMVVFVHGSRHDATVCDKSLACFRRAHSPRCRRPAKRLAKAASRRRHLRRVARLPELSMAVRVALIRRSKKCGDPNRRRRYAGAPLGSRWVPA